MQSSAPSNAHASVIILTRNGMPLIEDTLRSVMTQKTPWPFEVVAIDSGSTDGTWELLGSHPIKRVNIRPESFNHGATRNLGASQAVGTYLVFLVQDAVPIGPTWLQNTVRAVEESGAAGGYGRELPWPDDTAIVRLHMQEALPQGPDRQIQCLESGQSWSDLVPAGKLAIASFHNTCSCLRRDAWERFPFQGVPFGEDLEWGVRIIRAGYSIVYEPEAMVWHSHDRSSLYELKRSYADHELAMRLLGYRAFPRLTGLAKSWVQVSVRIGNAVWRESRSPREKVRLLRRALVVSGARHIGSYLGALAAVHHSPSWRRVDSLLRKGV